jgi:hypothetical protein
MNTLGMQDFSGREVEELRNGFENPSAVLAELDVVLGVLQQ